ncbi:MAG: efflux RND transporter periplasmic adaptor subunit [Isosphaeraceae bacterium]|nr:efflux RND transporter periplasmic adaptor subunit [Isosphaeraceae bacterium]
MIDAILAPSSPWAREALGLGLDVALRATVLCLLAFALHALLGRHRALVRSVLWNAWLVGLLLLPGMTAAFSRLRVDCLPDQEAPRISATPSPEADLGTPAVLPDPALGVGDVGAPAPPPNQAPGFDGGQMILLAYLGIAAALIARLAISLAAVGMLRRAGIAVEEPSWVEALERWRDRLGVTRPVRLVRSGRVGMPIVIGWRRPMILLPDALVGSASPRAIDAILLHELAHVRRGDYPWNLLLRLVQALYWPHPLVWLAGPVIAGVRERACDDLCIFWVGDAQDYRLTLLDLAAGLVRWPRGSLGLAMTRSTHLGRRLRALERSRGAARCLLRWPARAAIIAAVVVAVGLLGSVELTRRAAAQGPAPILPSAPAQRDRAVDDHHTRPLEGLKPAAEPRDQAPGEPERGAEAPARRVKVETLKKAPFPRTTVVVGTAQASVSADLYARVSGTLKSQSVDIGDVVRRGQVLAEIDAPDLRIDLARARAVSERAKIRLHQVKAAVAIAQAMLEGDEAKVEQAQAEAARTEAARDFRESQLRRYEGLEKVGAGEHRLTEEARSHFMEAQAAARAAKAQLRAAEASLVQSQTKLEASQADIREAEVDVRVTEADLAKAQVLLDATKIISPLDGIVTRRSYNVGDYVRATGGNVAPVFTILRTDPIRVVAQVPERDVPFLDRGDPAIIRFDALVGRTFRGRVSRTAVDLDRDTQTLRAEIDLTNPDGHIRPGMHGSVTIILQEEGPEASTIPTSAAFPSPHGWTCFRVVDGRAVRTPIQTGWDDGQRIEVLEGLREGDIVITDRRGIEDGQAVAIDPGAGGDRP